MSTAQVFSAADCATRLLAEQARRELVEVALAAAQVRIVALELRLAAPAYRSPVAPSHSPNPVLRLAATGEILYANLAAAPLLLALAAAAGLPPQLLALVHTALQAPEQQEQQEVVLDGQCYLCTAVAEPSQAYATLHLTNLTARQRAEQQVADQRAFHENVLELLPTGVAVFDAQHRYLFVNPAVEPDPTVRAWMLGKTNEEACIFRQRSSAIAQQRRVKFDEATREQREVTWEEIRPDRSTGFIQMLMRFRPVLDAAGTLRLMICSGNDITERKQVEEKMTQQQEFYESILNLLPMDVAVFDANHRFVFVNPAAISDPEVRQRIIGMTNAESAAYRPQPAGVAEQREQYFALAVRTRADVTWEEMRTDRRQRPKLMLRYMRPVYAADGTLRLVVGSGIDITARYTAEKIQQRAQTMLQEQQAFIRQIVDALPNVLYMTAPDGSLSFSNRAYHEAMARSLHQPGAEADGVVLEERRQMQLFSDHVQVTRQAETRELPFTHISGETFYYQVYKKLLPQADGQWSILTISTDTTAVKQARQALERREKQYHDLVYYSQVLICTHDMQGRVLSVNPAIEQLFGLPAAQMIGHHLSEALPPKYHAALQAYLDGAMPWYPQARLITMQNGVGERLYISYYTYQVTEEGYPSYVVASGYDVTQGVLAKRILEQAKREAEENAQAKEGFLSRMSHEIRTPLNGVLGMAALLQKTFLTTPQREYLNTMQHAGRHLLSLLNDVLDMAKITAQHLDLDLAPFDLAVALLGAGQTVAALAKERGLELVIEPLLLDRPQVLGDAYRLHQVLLNLLSNAIKFTERGSVRLGAAVLRDTPQALTLRFWVEDTGIGIVPAQQERIFEAFAQASDETSLRFGGTGLGLAISQQLVSQMGGFLQLCSVPDVGTTLSFQLTLPRPGDIAAEQPLVPAAASYEGLRGVRVLLAEDNLVNQMIAVAVLNYWGVLVTAVSNGVDALARLRDNVYDAAILDIKMPGLSGVEVTTAIRASANPERANIPIIALTANAFEADRVAYLAAGMSACITKPYEEADLCELLLRLVSEARSSKDE